MEDDRPEYNPCYCPDCGAEVSPSATHCWCCHGSFLQGLGPAVPSVAAKGQYPFAGDAADRTRFQFGIASLLLITTLTAVLLSIFTMAPGVGIGLSILALPALVRTMILAMQKRSRGKPMSTAGKIGFFLVWMGLAAIVLLVIGASVIAAFFAICAFGFNHNDLTAILVVIGIVATIVVVLLIVLFRRIIKLF